MERTIPYRVGNSPLVQHVIDIRAEHESIRQAERRSRETLLATEGEYNPVHRIRMLELDIEITKLELAIRQMAVPSGFPEREYVGRT